MNFIVRICRGFKRWISGDYPLWFTYWITGVIPQLLFFFTSKLIDHNKYYISDSFGLCLLVITISVIGVLYTLLSLFAIMFSTINYEGFWLWKFLVWIVIFKSFGTLIMSISDVLEILSTT